MTLRKLIFFSSGANVIGVISFFFFFLFGGINIISVILKKNILRWFSVTNVKFFFKLIFYLVMSMLLALLIYIFCGAIDINIIYV